MPVRKGAHEPFQRGARRSVILSSLKPIARPSLECWQVESALDRPFKIGVLPGDRVLELLEISDPCGSVEWLRARWRRSQH